MNNNPHPYLLAFFTALLAGLFSLFGSYFVAKYQVDQGRISKEKEYKVQAYKNFLDNLNREKSPTISKFLHIGSLSEKVTTDGDIQRLEDSIEELMNTTDLQETYWKLNSEFNILRIYGDDEIDKICSDILDLISLNYTRIEWKSYSPTIQKLYKDVSLRHQKGIVIGWEEKVLPEDRISIIMTSRIFQELIFEMKKTIKEQ